MLRRTRTTSGFLFLYSLNVFLSLQLFAAPFDELREGDVVFQISRSSQSQAIQLATGSKYSHVGIIFTRAGRWVVFEAVQPVRFVDLSQWIKNGERSHYVVKRYADGAPDASQIAVMKKKAEAWAGRNYDGLFRWSDDRLYCSEVVWKLYDLVGLKTVPLKRFSDYDLKHPIVQQKMKQRYGGMPPLNELAVSPGDLFVSDRFRTVFER